MTARSYVNEDGSLKYEILAEQRAAKATSAQRHGVDEKQVGSLVAEVRETG